ncbi:hypothetical protein MNV49_004386 [Pseudohyphozyma bogoriensis]|nr:hypothetical protein MNV49_004386 [Pseudohyphozyma bogoriensis]
MVMLTSTHHKLLSSADYIAYLEMVRQMLLIIKSKTNPSKASPDVLCWSKGHHWGMWLEMQMGLYRVGRLSTIIERGTVILPQCVRLRHLPELPEDVTEVAIPPELLAFIHSEIEEEPGWTALFKHGPSLYKQLCTNAYESHAVDAGLDAALYGLGEITGDLSIVEAVRDLTA